MSSLINTNMMPHYFEKNFSNGIVCSGILYIPEERRAVVGKQILFESRFMGIFPSCKNCNCEYDDPNEYRNRCDCCHHNPKFRNNWEPQVYGRDASVTVIDEYNIKGELK